LATVRRGTLMLASRDCLSDVVGPLRREEMWRAIYSKRYGFDPLLNLTRP
jgi:hypothetical protein